MKSIVLANSKGIAIVDDGFYPFLSTMKWYISNNKNNKRYAYTSISKNGKRSHLGMHRFIVGIYSQGEVDHINGHGLDNRKSNLRIVTRSENQANRSTSNGLSIYKGVFWHRDKGLWKAQVYKHPNRYYLGSFSSEINAAIAYDVKACEVFGKYACLNFPDYFRKKAED